MSIFRWYGPLFAILFIMISVYIYIIIVINKRVKAKERTDTGKWNACLL